MARRISGILFPAVLFLGSAVCTGALAQIRKDYPIPGNAPEAYSPIREGFEAPIEPLDLLRGPRKYTDIRRERVEARRAERLPGRPAFFRDTDLRVNSRTYLFDENRFDLETPRALTTGGSIVYQSGAIAEIFQLRGVVYTSQELDGNEEAGLTLNLSPDGDGLTTLGQLNGRVNFAGQEITAGRMLVRTPYINPRDTRMIPLTFEGVVVLPEEQGQDQRYDYIASYLTRYKPRDRTEFIPLSEGLGVAQDEGVFVAGAGFYGSDWHFGFINYFIKDTLNTAYGEVDYLLPPILGDDGPSFRLSANLLDQRTVGADLITGAPFETFEASARLIGSHRGFVFTGSFSQVGDENVASPFGLRPAYTRTLIGDFGRAGMRTVHVSLSYDLGEIGLPGANAKAAWIRGKSDLLDDGFGDQEEIVGRLTYEPRHGALLGWRVAIEYADLQAPEQEAPSQRYEQFRVIANYSVPLL